MKTFENVLLCFGILWFVSVCSAQNITDVEVKPYGSYVGGTIDQVDLATGNLFLHIPIISYPQLGKLPPLSFSVGLNNAPYAIDWACEDPPSSDCIYAPNRYDPSPPGSISQGGINVGALLNAKLGAYITSSLDGGVALGQYVFSTDGGLAAGISYSMIDPSGNAHELGSDGSSTSLWNTYRALDGTGYVFAPSFAATNGDGTAGNAYDPSNLSNVGFGCCDQESDPSWNYWLNSDNYSYGGLHAGTAYSPTGIQYTTQFVLEPQLPALGNGSPSRLVMTTETDPSGVNSITRGPWYWTNLPVNAASISAFYGSSTSANYPVYTDSQGHKIPDVISLQETVLGIPGATTGCPTIPGQALAAVTSLQWGPPGPGGNPLSYRICYVQLNLTYDWAQDPGFTPQNAIWETGYAIQSIVLPDGKSYWGFVYDQSATCTVSGQSSPCGSGDLLTVSYPTGGSISYTYGNIGTDSDGQQFRCTSSGFPGRCHVVLTRTENDGASNVSQTTYNYAAIPNGSYAPVSYTTTETTSGNDIVHTFSAIGSTVTASIALVTNQLFETETDYFQGSATTSGCVTGSNCLRAQYTSYNGPNWDIPAPSNLGYDGGEGSATRIVNALPILIETYNPASNKYTEVSTNYPSLYNAVGITCGWNVSLQMRTCNPMSVEEPTDSGYFDVDNYAVGVSFTSPTEQDISGPTGTCGVCWLQTTMTSYQLNSPTSSAYLNENAIALPVSVENTAYLGGSPLYAQTTYAYDTGGIGNLTSVSRWLNATTNVTTNISYNGQGMPHLTTDANQNQIKTTAFQCSGLYPQSVTAAFGSTTTVPETTSYVYDCYTGAMTSTTDPNGVQTSYDYASDPLGRLKQVQYGILGNAPAQSTTTLNYNNNMTETDVAQDQTVVGDGNITSATIYDGLGRVIQQKNAAGYFTCTTYNATGQVATVSNPVSSCPASSANVITYNYDPLGRLIKETEQDTNTLWWCYDGKPDATYTQPTGMCSASPSNTNAGALSWVDSIDENQIHHQQVTNALGQIVASVEPNPQSGVLGLETDYTYDHNGNVSGVAQLGAGTSAGDSARTRGFSYDSLSRLTQSYNPETGWICYGTTPSNAPPDGSNCTPGYDPNGNLQYKTDARGVTTKYSYDALNRLLSKSYTNDVSGAASSCYQYDNTTTGANGVGRLWTQWTQKGTCPSSPGAGVPTKTLFSAYDAMGGLTVEQQCVFSVCSANYSGANPYSYGYDLAGHLTSFGDGLGVTQFTNQFDAAGRLLKLTSTWSDLLHPPTLFSAQSYSPAGGLTGGLYGVFGGNGGTAITQTRTYDNRLRITSESDVGNIIQAPAVPGTATVTIAGSELSK